MKGIELSEKFYNEVVKPYIAREFSDYENRIAAGLAGHGSECFGFDDETSKDHDGGTGLCLWICREDDEKIGFRLMRAYDKLAKEYGVKGVERTCENGFRGVFVIDDFYRRYTGCDARRKRGRTGCIRTERILRKRRTASFLKTTLANLAK